MTMRSDDIYLSTKNKEHSMVKCPKCGHEFSDTLKCNRCGHTWKPRNKDPPTVCPNPKCKSPYWNKPRHRKKKLNNKK